MKPKGKSSNKKNKLVVTFDAEKRKDYLTGFHKRKQDRRRYGHDMEAFKKKKAQIEARKIRKAEQREMLAGLPEVANIKPAADPKGKAVVEFNDEHTQGKFGDVVTVTTSVGELQSDSEEELDDEVGRRDDDDETLTFIDDTQENELLLKALAKKKDRANRDAHLTLFQRVQQKRKGVALPTKRSKIKAAKANAKRNGGGKVVFKKGGKAGADTTDDKPDKRKGFHKTRKGSKHTA
ncbi:Aste57867_22725 [Aphanomyces stellatus]|uniref:Aste57867_22725 protein n=1 Tax=Aphanomyces stellatus TaxID=120398 RepID=A0A485LKQ5_9STRA|nr:hypothetical protein As57867_022655 [Aphanomyces stellatus]VFT99378.1 Aste57867_22725 [Aphanomyces stellatus]